MAVQGEKNLRQYHILTNLADRDAYPQIFYWLVGCDYILYDPVLQDYLLLWCCTTTSLINHFADSHIEVPVF